MPPAAPMALATAPGAARHLLSAEAREIREILAGQENDRLSAFYAARGYSPLWLEPGRIAPEARSLIGSARMADEHGLAVRGHAIARAQAALAQAGDDAASRARAELALTRLLVDWIGDLNRPPTDAAMIFADPALPPPPAEPQAVLAAFAEAPSRQQGLTALQAKHPMYEELRAAWRGAEGDEADLLRLNLERARALPAAPAQPYVLVDVAAQRLEVWKDGERVADDPVVVGRPKDPTPAMAGLIRFAIVNPYWHMPPDIAAEQVAPHAIRAGGTAALRARDLEILTNFKSDAKPVDPDQVDWRAVADGRAKAFLRQRPGPANTMGRIKFIFPNRLGVYLHDTPRREVFDARVRTASAGCVRLSDADNLAQLLGATVPEAAAAETRVPLPRPTPVFLIYLTARIEDGRVVRRPDIYGRDRAGEAPSARKAE
jgi:murein L,D-transpeptidase YcbB/YkuD